MPQGSRESRGRPRGFGKQGVPGAGLGALSEELAGSVNQVSE